MAMLRTIAEEVAAFAALTLVISTVIVWSAIACGA